MALPCVPCRFAVFMQPEWWQPMDNDAADADKARVMRGTQGELLPPGVPDLSVRWKPGQKFGDFVQATLGAYH